MRKVQSYTQTIFLHSNLHRCSNLFIFSPSNGILYRYLTKMQGFCFILFLIYSLITLYKFTEKYDHIHLISFLPTAPGFPQYVSIIPYFFLLGNSLNLVNVVHMFVVVELSTRPWETFQQLHLQT